MRFRAGLLVYGGAFGAMLAAAVVLAVGVLGTLQSMTLYWVSSGLSAVAIVASVVAILIPRR